MEKWKDKKGLIKQWLEDIIKYDEGNGNKVSNYKVFLKEFLSTDTMESFSIGVGITFYSGHIYRNEKIIGRIVMDSGKIYFSTSTHGPKHKLAKNKNGDIKDIIYNQILKSNTIKPNISGETIKPYGLPHEFKSCINISNTKKHIKTFIKLLINESFSVGNYNTLNDIRESLEYNKQIILSGPPGTGKTRMAKILALDIINDISEVSNTDLEEKLEEHINNERVKLVQFHPSYSYEDFIVGIEVSAENGSLNYETKGKVFYEFAKRAKTDEENKPYILIIDEINRAPLSSVLGELLYALEYRDKEITLQYGKKLTIPSNMYIIGTMNTADRSIKEMDYALRRRFSFVKILPQVPSKLEDNEFAYELFEFINKIFDNKKSISKGIDSDDVRIGTSYFIYKNKNHLEYKIRYEIIPILKEYFKDGILTRRSKCGEYELSDVVSKKHREESFIKDLLEKENE